MDADGGGEPVPDTLMEGPEPTMGDNNGVGEDRQLPTLPAAAPMEEEAPRPKEVDLLSGEYTVRERTTV